MKGSGLTIGQTDNTRCAVEASGIGLHTAVPFSTQACPAPPERIRLHSDRPWSFEIPAARVGRALFLRDTLMRTGVMLSTLSSCCGSAWRGGDNVYIEVDNLEIPIMEARLKPSRT